MRSTARGGLADEGRQCALEPQGHPHHERAVTKHKPVFRLIHTLVMQDRRKLLSAGAGEPRSLKQASTTDDGDRIVLSPLQLPVDGTIG